LYLSLFLLSQSYSLPRDLPSFPTRRSSDLSLSNHAFPHRSESKSGLHHFLMPLSFSRFFSSLMNSCTSLKSMYTDAKRTYATLRSEEHTSELQSLRHLVCRLLLEKKKK